MHLSGSELLDWIALRRVHEGGVALHRSAYVHWGQKVPCYLPEVFTRLAEAGLTSLLDPDCAELRRVVCTPPGRDRYQKLSTQNGLPEDPEQPPGGCSVSPDRPPSPLRPVRVRPQRAIQ